MKSNNCSCPVEVESRSRMNIPFRIGEVVDKVQTTPLEMKFLKGADNIDMISLKGHR